MLFYGVIPSKLLRDVTFLALMIMIMIMIMITVQTIDEMNDVQIMM